MKHTDTTSWIANSANTLIKYKSNQNIIKIVINNGRAYALKKSANTYHHLVLSGLPTLVQTKAQQISLLRDLAQSYMQLQGQFLTALPRMLGGVPPYTSLQEPRALADWFEKNPISSLDLSHYRMSSIELTNLIVALPSTVTTLLLDSNHINPDAAKILSIHLPQKNITSLSLQSCGLNEETMSILAPAFTSLVSLNMDLNQIGGNGIRYLVEILPSSKLSTLSLTHCRLSIEDTQILLQTLPSTSISEINLSHNPLPTQANPYKNLQFPSQLKICRLRTNHINDANAIDLAKAFSNCSLQELDLGMNDIGDKGAMAFATLAIKHLILNWNNISEAGAEYLTADFKTGIFDSLDLSSNAYCRGKKMIWTRD